MQKPENLLFDRENSWVKIEGDVAVIGITEAATKKKEFIFIELPKKGEMIIKGSTYASLESVSWSGSFHCPVSGKIVDVNQSLFEHPTSINKNPYSNWLIKVKLINKAEISELYSDNIS